MARPEKPESEKRSKQIVVYVHENVKTALQKEADIKGISVSLLAAEILEQHISSTKNDDRRIVVHPDVVMAVVQEILQQGFEISDKFAPVSKSEQDTDSKDFGYPQPSVDKPVDSVGDERGAEFAPKTETPAPDAAETVQQRGDDDGTKLAKNKATRS